MQVLEIKFEDTFTSMQDQLTRKGSGEDLAYLRRDVSQMASRDELSEIRVDIEDQFNLLNTKIGDKDQYIKVMGENIEARVDQKLNEWKAKVNQRVEGTDRNIEIAMDQMTSQLSAQSQDYAKLMETQILTAKHDI